MLKQSNLKRLAPSRLTLMMILAGGLYLGPFLAGLSQQPGWIVVACAALIGFWSMHYRTAAWPRRIADLADLEVIAATILLVCLMLMLAALVFLAGLGLSMIVPAISLPTAAPLAVPLLSLIAAMLIQSPDEAAAMDAFLDDALRQLEALPAVPATPDISLTATAAAAKLQGLPASATEAEVRAVIGTPNAHDAALLAAIDKMGLPPPRPARLAAILIVTDPEGALGLVDRGEAGWVFDALHGDSELEALFARRALALLGEAPQLWRDMPYSYAVDQAAARNPNPDTARLLRKFRDRLNALSLTEEGSDQFAGTS